MNVRTALKSCVVFSFWFVPQIAPAGLVVTHDESLHGGESLGAPRGAGTFGTWIQVSPPAHIMNEPDAVYTQPFPVENSFIGNSIFYPPGAGGDIIVSANETPGPGPDQVTLEIEWKMADGFGTPMIPPHATISGNPVRSISFAIGTIAVTNSDGIDRDVPFTFDHPAVGGGFFFADFELLGAGGATILTADYHVRDNGPNGISGNLIISDHVNSLQGYGITGGRATIRLNEIPEPSSLSLLCLGAVAVLRRRRG